MSTTLVAEPVAMVDVAIVGGGLVGASLAAALQDSGLKLALVEAANPPRSAPSWDERCIALNDASRRILADFGVWQTLEASAAAITHTHISERGRFGATRFSALEAQLPALGYNTPLRLLGHALSQRLSAQENVQQWRPVRVQGLEASPEAVTLRLDNGRRIQAQLVVAADGADSALRQMLGLPCAVHDYQQAALVTAVRCQRSLQGVAYERFLPSGPLALIPKPHLPEDTHRAAPASLVWTLPIEQATHWCQAPEAEFLAAAQQAFGERAGRFLALGQRFCWPLKQTVMPIPHAARVVFCGNAAQSLHPVAAQGFNLGLRDVATLRAVLAQAHHQGQDLGALALLEGYSAARAEDRRSTANFTDQLVRVFSNQSPLIAPLRHWGLMALELTPPLRERVLRQNLGHRGLSS